MFPVFSAFNRVITFVILQITEINSLHKGFYTFFRIIDIMTRTFSSTLLFLFLIFFHFSANAQKENLKAQLESIIDQFPKGTKYSMLVYDPLVLDTFYAHNVNTPMIPASNVKLFTTAVALYMLGPDYPLSTVVLTDDTDISDSVIDGNLYLKGMGNSTFSSTDLSIICDSLTKLGIHTITGNIVGDDSFCDDEYYREDWTINEKTQYDLQAVSALSIDRNMRKTKRNTRYGTRTYYHNITNPTQYISKVLEDSLLTYGIVIGGGGRSGVTPVTAKKILSIDATVKEIVTILNKRSDNFRAEVLFKTLGAIGSGSQGTALNGSQTIHNWMKEQALYQTGTNIVDGSGLSRYNQLSAATIGKLLELVYMDLDMFPIFFESLSIAGIDGTLDERMHNSSAENNFRGKTGTLKGASAVSGFVKTKSGEDFIVSILIEFNRKGANYYRDLQDKLINKIAEYDSYSATEDIDFNFEK